MKKNIDAIFQKEINQKFSFNKQVAAVFDDMANRSIPYYRDNIILISQILQSKKIHSLCDMGCATGNLLLELSQNLCGVNLSGIDNSSNMLDIARAKAKAYGAKIDFIQADILDFDFNFDVVISNYTLQFIRPINRENLLFKIYHSLPKNGIFVLSEKLISSNKWLDKVLIDIYHQFKKEQGYSKTEISKKREALENILIPYTQEENIAMLKKAGFGSVEMIFRFANFATFIAIKEE